MLDLLLPSGIKRAALDLGLDPFEVTRLLVLIGELPHQLELDAGLARRVREAGGLSWLWNDVELPEDDNPKRARVRAALRILLDGGWVGDSTTRVDNLWRGLDVDDATLVRAAVAALVREGLLQTLSSPEGAQLSVVESGRAAIEGIAAGGSAPERVAAVWR